MKRFKIETTTLNNKFQFIRETEGNRVETVSTEASPVAIIRSGKGAQVKESRVRVADFVEVMGWKAVGNKLTDFTKSTEIEWLDTEGNKQTALF